MAVLLYLIETLSEQIQSWLALEGSGRELTALMHLIFAIC